MKIFFVFFLYRSQYPTWIANRNDVEVKRDLPDIISRSLSLKLTELMEHELVVKNVSSGTPVSISYQLTKKGQELAEALKPIQTWGQNHLVLNES